MSERTFVIVGASLAGAKAAEELRQQGFDGRLILIGSESELPYERPPLSKDYLRGESKREDMQVHDEAFYRDGKIELMLGSTVTEIDPTGGVVRLEDGEQIEFDALLLTTGASPRRLNLPGHELDGIHYLRTISDSEAIRAKLETGGHVAVIGGGWIGSEIAASARVKGLEVTMIADQDLPNAQVFGREIGEFYRDVHAKHGVELVFGDGAAAFGGDGSVSSVRTVSGRVVECDFVVVGAGAIPNIELAQNAGLVIDNGVVVDSHLRSSAPNVYAAGDIANAWHPFYEQRIRIEHWGNALKQGPAAARSMLGSDDEYELLPYFFSDQYDVGMEYTGRADPTDEVVFRGDRDAAEFIAFWLHDGRVTAGMNVNVWDVTEQIGALIRSRKQFDPAVLADPDKPLDSLV
jgi:3-phenylpropionate/trans-cinnamate dioxygenase ferredoxin reductase component